MIQTYEAPISELYLFPVYQTREEYERLTGEPCPPFDRRKPTKYWRDPAPPAGRRTVVYANVLATDDYGRPLSESGKPFFEPLLLLAEDAKRVNIPPNKGANEVDIPAPVQVPCRDLEGDEELAFAPGPLPIPIVRRPSLKPDNTPAVWTEKDAKILRAIAEKLGVEV